MAVIRPFECVRPQAEKAERVAALPYDVYNREEAKREVKSHPLSFLAKRIPQLLDLVIHHTINADVIISPDVV